MDLSNGKKERHKPDKLSQKSFDIHPFQQKRTKANIISLLYVWVQAKEHLKCKDTLLLREWNTNELLLLKCETSSTQSC